MVLTTSALVSYLDELPTLYLFEASLHPPKIFRKHIVHLTAKFWGNCKPYVTKLQYVMHKVISVLTYFQKSDGH